MSWNSNCHSWFLWVSLREGKEQLWHARDVLSSQESDALKSTAPKTTVGNPVRIPKFRRFVPIFLDFGRGNQLHMFACHGFGQIWSNRPPWNKGGMFFWCIWLCLGSSQKQNRGDWLVPNGKFNPTLYISHQPLHPWKLTLNPKKCNFQVQKLIFQTPFCSKMLTKNTISLRSPMLLGGAHDFIPRLFPRPC